MTYSTDLKIAIDKRDNKEYSIAVVKDETIIYKSKSRGILPLYIAYKDGLDFLGASVADKVIGKGAAIFLATLQAKEIHTHIISKPALSYLQSNNVMVSYTTLVDFIANRADDGRCPVETMAEASKDFDTFLDDVQQFLKRLELI